MIDVKPQLYWLELSEEDGIFDAAIAAYLINPLKDSYTYDGIAQDFLGMTVPSRADWMKKMTLTEASEKEKESFWTLSCVFGEDPCTSLWYFKEAA